MKTKELSNEDKHLHHDHEHHHDDHMKHEMHNHHDHEEHGHDDHGGHDHHGHHDHGDMIKEYRNLFFFSLILSIPILILSPMIQSWFKYSITFPGDKYVILVLATVLSVVGGKPFFTGAVSEIKAKSPGMMSLISLAIVISFSYSTAVIFGLPGGDFFWELATLTTIMLLGHYVEMKASASAGNALKSLTELMPSEANLLTKEGEKLVQVSSLELNDVVIIKPGDKVPVDGMIIYGQSTFDESMITGESLPVTKGLDEEVIGGTINGDNIVHVKISKIGKDTYLEQVISLVNNAQQNRSKTERLADVFAKYLFYVSIFTATLTAILWAVNGASTDFILEKVVTVIIIACPHALGLAIPLVTSVSTSIAAKNGLLIKNRTLFEQARKVDAIVFDKTGTLTEGKFHVSFKETYNIDESKAIDIIYSLEKNSNHPIAKGIINYGLDNKAKELKITDFANISGVGIVGNYNKKNYMAVSPAYLTKEKIKFDEKLTTELNSKGNTVIFLVEDKKVVGLFALEDKIKENSFNVIQALKKQGIRTILLTGDNRIVANIVGEALEIDEIISEVLPHEKADVIKKLKETYYVAMTGDGINDAPALAESNLGIAIGAGTDVAIETADIILVKSDPNDVLSLLKLSKATYNKMIQNLIWATAYNLIALPLAAGIFYNQGFNLPPAVGAILMSLSSVIVAINARMLRIK